MNTTALTRGILLDAAKVRDLRREHGWTQVELAVAADVSDDAVSRAERGIPISLDNARGLAAAFATDLANLRSITLDTGVEELSPSSIALSNIPIRVPTHFMGRDSALSEIEQALERHHGRVAITALYGLRGVGKTVLAAAYADRHAKDYRATWWIRAETESGMRADLVGLGVRLGWVDPEEKEEPALAAIMERLAHDGDGLLLIYDNALSADAIRPYLPRGGAARALITSNAHVWRNIATPIRLDVWPEDVGADFLMRRTGRTNEREAALELSELLGGLPLAHEQAAAYCERLEISLADYATRFKAEPARLLDGERDAAADYHDRTTVAKSFALAIEAAAVVHPASEMLIVLCSLLAPEPVPLFFFAETLGKPGGPLEGDSLDEAVAALRAFALVERQMISDERDPNFITETIRLHRLVREVAAGGCVGADREQALAVLIVAMTAVYSSGSSHDPVAWRRARRLDALAMALVTSGPPEAVADVAARLLNDLAGYRHHAPGAYDEARRLFERVLAATESRLGPEHPDTLGSINNLATSLNALGDAALALPLYRRLIDISERLFGPDERRTLIGVNNLAHCLQLLGDAAAALPLYRRALESCERVLGREHPQTLTSINNLAGCLEGLGDAAGALPLFRRVLESRERLLNPEHPQTLLSVNNLAGCLRALGDTATALPLCRRALESCEHVLGPEHPQTLTSINNLAGCLRALGDPAAASLLYQRAMESRVSVLGPEHPDTLSSLNNLAGCMWALGDAAALPLYCRAMESCERVLGPDHPNTRIVRSNLATLKAGGNEPSHPSS
ncbi:MAG TPA: FxSxx-COOH system tetratricopeptide repeat protein [Stellaceae bacterium]|nr:FxSxx-COOH system tetratricopeptide repeat protein [Stellaceae bacterium]